MMSQSVMTVSWAILSVTNPYSDEPPGQRGQAVDKVMAQSVMASSVMASSVMTLSVMALTVMVHRSSLAGRRILKARILQSA
jgi:hypothetical protein